MDARILLVVVLAALCACGGCSDMVGRSEHSDLHAYDWHLISYNDGKGDLAPPLPGTNITLRFGEDGTAFGNAGCNDYFTEFSLDGGLITFGPVGMTEKYCQDPPGVMRQERVYFALLSDSTRYAITGDRLVLSHYDVKKLLIFEPEE